MPNQPAYDLVVLLDPEAPEERRAQLIEEIKRQIDSGQAALKGDADWGMRRLSYEIDHRREAQYHLFQFEATPELLTQLNRSLSIDDSVLRHRIIRLPGEAPETPPKPPEEAPRRQPEERAAPGAEEHPPEGDVAAPAPAEPSAAAEAPPAPAEEPPPPAEETAPVAAEPTPEPAGAEPAPEPAPVEGDERT
jgi:small subunit ribosomal protein S6